MTCRLPERGLGRPGPPQGVHTVTSTWPGIASDDSVGVAAVLHVPSSDSLPWSAGSFSVGFAYSVQNYILGAEITPYQTSVLSKDGAAWLNVNLC